MGKKATNAESEQRTTTVLGFLVNGITRRDILQYSAKNWDLNARQTDEYIAKATDFVRAAAGIDKEERLGQALLRLDALYQQAIKDKDTRTALAVEAKIIELLGLAEAANLNVNVDFGDRQGAMDRWRESIEQMIGDTAPPDE